VRRTTRYALSAGVALAVTAGVLAVSREHWLVILSLPLVYGATTAVGLRYRRPIRAASREDPTRRSRVFGAVGGGVGAFAGSALLQTSVPVGVAGLGLMLFGAVLTAAQFAELDG
jgi:hypothetical protein